MNVAYSFSWSLLDADFDQVCDIMKSLRQYAVDLGSDMVSDLIVEPDARQVYFTATIPGSTEGSMDSYRLKTLPGPGMVR